MPHISDSRFEALRAQLPLEPPTTNDLLFAWTLTQGGSGDTLNDRIYSMLISQGATPGHVNDMWAQVLVLQGLSGSLNDQLKQFWEAGGSFSGSPLDNYLLDTTNLDEYLLEDGSPDVYLLEDAPDPDIDAYTLTTPNIPFTIAGNNHLTPWFNLAGDRCYFSRSTSVETWQYSMSPPGNMASITTGFELTHNWGTTQFQRGMAFTPDRAKVYKIRTDSGGGDRFISADPFSVTEMGDVAGGNPYTLTGVSALSAGITPPTSPVSFVVMPDNLNIFVQSADVGDVTIYHYLMSIAGDANTAVFQASALDASSEFATRLLGIIYSPAGNKLFVLGDDGGTLRVAQYDMSVAFNINTAVYSGKRITVTPLSQTLLSLFVWKNPAGGFKLYLTWPTGGASNGASWRYDLYDAP